MSRCESFVSLLVRAIFCAFLGHIGDQVPLVNGADTDAIPEGIDESVAFNLSKGLNEFDEEFLSDAFWDVGEDDEETTPPRSLGATSRRGCCRRRRGCGDRRRAQVECSSPPPPRRRVPAPIHIDQRNNCGDNSNCPGQGNVASVYYVDCEMAQSDTCTAPDGSKVYTKGNSAKNSACRQSIATFWQEDVRAQSCTGGVSNAQAVPTKQGLMISLVFAHFVVF